MPAVGQGTGKSEAGERRVQVRAHTRRVAPAKPPRPAPQVNTQHSRPSATSIARAQEQQYVSQGAAVKKEAKRQVRQRRLTSPAKRPSGDAPQTRAKDLQRAQTYVKSEYQRQAASDKAKGIVKSPRIRVKYKPATTVPPDVAERAKERQSTVAHKAEIAGKVAPVLKVLEQTSRPIHAVAGAADAAVTGKNVLHAASRGIQNKDKTTFSDVLKHAGVKNKLVRGVVGTGLDIGLDPTTYVTGGTGAVARKGAEKAAEGAAENAAKGVTVKVAGKQVPGVTKATAKAGQTGGKAVRRVVPERARNAVREAVSEVNPNVPPPGVSKATHEAARQASRKARATTNRGQREAINLAHGIRKKIGEKNYAQVIDAIEAGDLSNLPHELAQHAETLRGQFADIRHVQKKAGVKVPERKGYVPRKLTKETIEAENKRPVRVGGRGKAEPASSKARKEQRTMAELREQEPGRYREDLHALAAERVAEGHASAARATLAQDLAKLGHPVERGTKVRLSDREGLYRVKKGKDLEQVQPNDKRFLKPGKPGSDTRYVVLNKHLVDRAVGGVTGPTGGAIKHGYDKTTSVFKRVALATPGFHIRNMIGDTAQAYVHQPGHKLPGNMVRAGRVLKALGREEKAQRVLERPGAIQVKHARDIRKRPIKRTRLQAQRLLHQRDLGRNDYPELAKAAALEKHKGEPNSLTIERQNLRHSGGHVAVYRYFNEQGENVGWARLHSNGGRSVYVRPDYRRQGIATKLYRAAEKDGFDIRNPGGGNMQTELGDVLNRSMNKPKSSGGTLKTKHYGDVSYEEAARKLIDAGAARSGYTSRELRELATSGSKKLKTPKSPAGVRRAFLNREDLPRLATAIHALREGATYEEAAARVAGAHFDYAELSPFERNVARRIMPFYTWTSRNVPLQAKRLVTNPGKYAAYEKVREEGAKLTQPGQVDENTKNLYRQLEQAGVKLPGGYERYLSTYEQRNAGVPVSWKGHKFTLSAGLPLQDLNELPGVSGPGEYLNKAASLVTPLVKDPVELGFNYSFFFRDQVERDTSPLVAAPSFVGKWPEGARRKLGVVKAVDKRSGKMVWQWPGKVDYVAHAIPGLPSTAVKMATPGHDRQGKSFGGKALGVAGIKSTPVDPTTNAVNLAYARQQEIQKRLATLRQQGIGKDNPNAEWRRLSDQLKITTQIAYQGKVKRGDKVLPKQGGPRKVRRGGGVVLGGGGVKLGGGSGVKLGGSSVKLN